MPWPYANYFCNIPPWHGYVQTWYDTTTRQTVDSLVAALRANPPEWIVYQRSMQTLFANEQVFGNHARLPHRDIDDLIAKQLTTGAWALPLQSCFDGADWLVIHTRPAKPGEKNQRLFPADRKSETCNPSFNLNW